MLETIMGNIIHITSYTSLSVGSGRVEQTSWFAPIQKKTSSR